MTHEIMMKRNDVDESKKNKNLAINVEIDNQDSQDSDTKNFAMFASRFNRFMRSGKFNQIRRFKKIMNKRKKVLKKLDVMNARKLVT